jgi:molybdate transport system substrate-binding protein
VAAALAVVVAFALVPGAKGDVSVATSGTFTAAYLELVPQLERVTNDKIVTATTSMGVGANSIPSRVQRGEPIDVVIVADTALEQLIDDGLVLADSRVDLARSGIGLAVRAGAPLPDISTVDALKATLLNARSIAYSASVSGTYVSTELFQRLGIADQVAGKSRRIDGERVGAVVARGDAQIGFQQMSELLPITGLKVVGPLPAEVQKGRIVSRYCAVMREIGISSMLTSFLRMRCTSRSSGPSKCSSRTGMASRDDSKSEDRSINTKSSRRRGRAPWFRPPPVLPAPNPHAAVPSARPAVTAPRHDARAGARGGG